MPETRTKASMLARLETERRRLEQAIAGIAPQDMLLPGVVDESSVKDVLAHLADWEEHMPAWVEAARRGPVPEIEPGLNWKQFEEFNRRIFARHREQPLDEVLVYFHGVHRRFMQMVESMPEDEMLAPGRYAFTGKGAIYNWLKSYANHDAWGRRHIRAWLKERSSP